MVGGDEQRAARLRRAVHAHLQPQHTAGDAVPQARQAAADLEVEAQTDKLDRQEDEGHREEDGEADGDAQPGDHAGTGEKAMAGVV